MQTETAERNEARPGSAGRRRAGSRSPESGAARRRAAFFVVALALLPAALAADSPRVDPKGYTSARICGECHTDIYDTWKNSLHAFSLTDPIFDTAYMESLRIAGDRAKRLCLSCHAPMTQVNGDFDLELGVTREGVSCDFCHTVTAVHLDREVERYSLQPGIVKRSVLKKAESEAHEVAYSKLHETSEFCGGCHNLVTPAGVEIMGTYDEWRAGPYAAEGVQCQDCHMASTRGNVVRPEVKGGGSTIHVHSLLHDSDQVRGALSLRIVSAEKEDDGLVVVVEIENVGSGHMVPTGIPTREVVLSVEVAGSGYRRTEERRYRKIVADERNRVLDRDSEVLLLGTKILNDTRIAPRETRTERLKFRMEETRGAKVTARLSYVYSPLVVKRERLDIKLAEAEQFVF